MLCTTVMTGFPGEGREEFEGAVLLYQRRCGFERLGCFAFSPEEGPRPIPWRQLSDKVKNRRRDIIMETQSRIAAEYNEAQVGRTLEVLVEGYDRYAGCWFGRSAADAPGYRQQGVFHPARGRARVKPGDMINVKITDVLIGI